MRLAHAEALNGMTLAVSNGTSLVMELDPSDPALAAKGVRMEKSATPFVLAEGMSHLPLLIAAAGDAPAGGNPFTHGILTVTNDADVVASVRSMLPSMSGRVFRGYSQELVETEDAEAGTVFCAPQEQSARVKTRARITQTAFFIFFYRLLSNL